MPNQKYWVHDLILAEHDINDIHFALGFVIISEGNICRGLLVSWYALLMPKIFVDASRHRSYEDVIRSLQKVQTRLPSSKLESLMAFSQAYLIVTSTIQKYAKVGAFQNPKSIETFTVAFSRHYFDAINNYFENPKALPYAWATLTNSMPNAPHFMQLMAGANAHINHDLPITLDALLRSKKSTDNLLQDLRQLDKVLMESGHQIVASLHEPNPRLDFLRRNLKFAYFRPAMYTILYWRIRAFGNYRRIQKYGVKESGYSQYSQKLANRINHISKIIMLLAR